MDVNEITVFTISLVEKPTPELRTVIFDLLEDYNASQVGAEPEVPLAVTVLDENSRVVGGLWGLTYYGWLFVELLIIPDAARRQGLGTRVLASAEREAVCRGSRGVWLDTFDFQAREFYERLGYEVFGAIDDYPDGHTRYFLRKLLRSETTEEQ